VGGILIFKMISGLVNSNKFQKTTVWNEKSVDNVVTFEGLPFNSKLGFIHLLVYSCYHLCDNLALKTSTNTLQQHILDENCGKFVQQIY